MINALPRIHAAILAFGDRTQELTAVLDRLEALRLERIVVVANQVTDSTRELLSHRMQHGRSKYECTFSEHNLGSAGGYAQAVRTAFSDPTCEYVWLLDDDNLPALDAYTALQRACSTNDPIGPRIFVCYRPGLPEIRHFDPALWQCPPMRGSCVGFNILNVFKRYKCKKPLLRDANGYIPMLWAAYGGMLLPRQAQHVCGLPNTSLFLYGDDTEWTLRLQRGGFPIRLVPDAVINDLQASWNATGEATSNIVRRVRDLPAQRVYFEVRNRNWLALTALVGNAWLYRLNRALFLSATWLIAARYQRMGRYRLIRQAICDAEARRLGNQLPSDPDFL